MPLLSISDLFLLPSHRRASASPRSRRWPASPGRRLRVGGLPEVIEHGGHRLPARPDDLDGMAASGVPLLTDPALHAEVAAAARRTVPSASAADLIVPRYEAFYAEVIANH